MTDYGQPVQKKSNVWKWIGLGCGALVVGLVAFIAFILIVVFGSMRSSTPYQDAMARAQNDPRVIEALGSPVKPGYFISGQINTNNNDGDVNISIPLHGPKGGGILEVKGTKTSGTWKYESMKVVVKGESIDLMPTRGEQ
jgi:hypothetical protein